MLEAIGIDPRRFKLDWVSASEGKRFSELVKSFTDQVEALGPLKMKIA
nr:hydrogenase iron-sulfur subunit [Candidatus Sigynarchaeum springense]